MLKRFADIIAREAQVNLNYRMVVGFGARRSVRSPGGAARAAIVRLDLIGDFVLFTAALPFYRAAFPGAHLTLFGNSIWGELAQWLNAHHVVTDAAPLFDEFVGVEPARLVNLPYFRSLAGKLAGADVVINAAFSRTNAGDKAVAAAGRESIAMTGDTTNILTPQKRWNDRLYTRLIPNSTAETEWERNYDLVQALAPVAVIARMPPMWKLDSGLADAKLARLAKTTGMAFDQPFIAVSPFASLAIKQWPLERYRDLIGRILEARSDTRVALLGGPDKSIEPDDLVRGLARVERVVNLVGRTSLVEATCLIHRSQLSISGDTAAGHLASAVGTPAVVMMGGGHYGRFFPYDALHATGANHAVIHRMDCFQCNWFCKYRRFSNAAAPCLEGVSVDEVLEAVIAQLDRKE